MKDFEKEYYDTIMLPAAKQKEIQFKNKAHHLVKNFQPSNVLDVGCGMGFFVKYLRYLNVNVYGIDISKYAISFADDSVRKYLTVLDMETTQLPLAPGNNKWDVITIFDVLEHLQKPNDVIANISAILKPGGVVFVYTPTTFVNSKLYLTLIGNFKGKLDPTHINVHNQRYWARLFSQYGMAYKGTYVWDGDYKISPTWTGRLLRLIPFGQFIYAYMQGSFYFQKME